MKNLFYYILTFLVLIITSCAPSTCQEYLKESIEPLEFKGIIHDKYLDEFNRRLPVIKIKNDNSVHRLDLYNIHDYFFEQCSTGDSIYKSVGNSNFIIVKPSGKQVSVILDCRNSR